MIDCPHHLHCGTDHTKEYSRDGNLVFVQCEDCGIVSRSSDSMSITSEYEENYFDSKKYLNRRKHKIEKSEWLIRIALDFNSEISNLLEVGCSIGNTLEAAKRVGIKHMGIDISQFAVDYCKKNGLNAEKLTLENLLEDKNLYDLIFMQHVLEHFPDPFDVLEKCYRLLNKNGLLLILVPNLKYRRAVKGRENHRFYSQSGVGAEHYVYFNYKNLSDSLNVKGFDVVQQNYPALMKKRDTLIFFMNRIYRKSLSLFNLDQEILVISRKRG